MKLTIKAGGKRQLLVNGEDLLSKHQHTVRVHASPPGQQGGGVMSQFLCVDVNLKKRTVVCSKTPGQANKPLC